MASISHLKEIFSKKGLDFIQDLFSFETLITEKLDGTAFSFEKIDGELHFYKRNEEISLVDRTLMQYFEKPILYIESLDIKKIPENYRFNLEYFVNQGPVSITYDKLPKNHLVLTNIQNGNKIIDSPNELIKWAKVLQVEEPPIIFNGKLSEKQKEELINFLETPQENLLDKFKTVSFVKFILTILNPSLKSSHLMNDLDKSIEGIVFKFNKNGDEFLAKIVDPIFQNHIQSKIKKETDKRDNSSYLEVIEDFCFFFNKINLAKFELKESNDEKRYIELMSLIFNEFMHNNFYHDLDFYIPDFLKREEFTFNFSMIKNEVTLKILKSSEKNVQIFKTLLTTFKKTRLRPTELVKKEKIAEINNVVTQLNNKIHQKLKYFQTFENFRLI